MNWGIRILDNALFETRVTLGDGGERHFELAPEGMQINVPAQATTIVAAESWASVKAARR